MVMVGAGGVAEGLREALEEKAGLLEKLGEGDKERVSAEVLVMVPAPPPDPVAELLTCTEALPQADTLGVADGEWESVPAPSDGVPCSLMVKEPVLVGTEEGVIFVEDALALRMGVAEEVGEEGSVRE